MVAQATMRGDDALRVPRADRKETAILLDRARSALVLVDFQTRLMPAIEGGEAAIDEALFLANIAHALHVPVLGTEQNPRGLGPNDGRIRALCEHTAAKMHFDGATDGLMDALRMGGRNVEQVVLAGCEAHVCLMQTTLGLQRAGLEVMVVPAACGSRRAADKALAMQRLAQGGVVLGSSEMIAFEWLRNCTDPRFKQVLGVLKERDRGAIA